jgi:KDO2-lipid IV(A) lauroyltransferase
MNMHRFYFTLVLVLTWPLRFLPFWVLHALGRLLGSCVYVCVPKFRKRALSNLSLATALHLSNGEIRRYAKESLQNLMITCLEYAKFASLKTMKGVARCVNPETAQTLMDNGMPVIFFCGHLANWEVLLLEGTERMKGVAIGRPIKNVPLYNWVVKIREKFGGKIIAPKNAIREGLRGLKQGLFLGIVGDQGMPDSGFCCPFLGRKAWTSPMAAILSHRTGAPIIVATTKREKGRYWIHYADPLWPDKEAPMQQEVERLMKLALVPLEEAIREHPGQWLWSHNRWKQQTPDRLKKAFRHESILIILPQEGIVYCTPPSCVNLDSLETKQNRANFVCAPNEEHHCQIGKGDEEDRFCEVAASPNSHNLGGRSIKNLKPFRTFYPHEFITIYAPEGSGVELEGAEIVTYKDPQELFKEDYRFKLVFNFTPIEALNTHFKKLAAFTAISLRGTEQLNTLILKSDAS